MKGVIGAGLEKQGLMAMAQKSVNGASPGVLLQVMNLCDDPKSCGKALQKIGFLMQKEG